VTELTLSPPADGAVAFRISCSSGTYIRSIASELGDKVGSGAHLEALRRTRIGDFRIEDAVGLSEFEAMRPEERLRPPHAVPLARVHFPFERVRLASLEAWKIRKGQSIPARGVGAREGDWVTLVGPSDEMLALAQVAPIGHGGVSLIRPRVVLE
jgi:tRNA pseudouridine55 synthase